MERLNYHHLRYFLSVAREGSIARASAVLRVAKPTISGQIHRLEQALGEKLFVREGRRLVLSETGRVALEYAEEIFSLGTEFLETVRGREGGRPIRLRVGIAEALPKLVVRRLLEPALELVEPVRLVCWEDRHERLLAALSVHELDVVLSDTPIGPGVKIAAFNHLLGESGISFFGTAPLAAAHRRRFPARLDGAPVLFPGENTALRRGLDQWLDARGIRPLVVGEFDDSALLKAFGQRGMGFFPAPSVIEADVRRQYQVRVIGRVEMLRERYFAISSERKLRHPAVVAITAAARETVFR